MKGYTPQKTRFCGNCAHFRQHYVRCEDEGEAYAPPELRPLRLPCAEAPPERGDLPPLAPPPPKNPLTPPSLVLRLPFPVLRPPSPAGPFSILHAPAPQPGGGGGRPQLKKLLISP